MRRSLPFCAALSAILATSFSDSAAQYQLEQPTTVDVELSPDDFNALLEAARSLPGKSLSPNLRRAVQDWTMIAYSAERVSGTGTAATKASIYFEPTEKFGPIIVCTSPTYEIEWTHCEEASVELRNECP